MAQHSLPSLPMMMNVWHWPNTPGNPPDALIPAALRTDVTNTSSQYTAATAFLQLIRMIYVAKGTDLRPQWPVTARCDIVELPAGTGRIYLVADVDDVAKGDPNEFRTARVIPNTLFPGSWPQPIP